MDELSEINNLHLADENISLDEQIKINKNYISDELEVLNESINCISNVIDPNDIIIVCRYFVKKFLSRKAIAP